MKIIIIGAGKVGYTLASTLSQQDHDISIIDNNSMVLSKIEDSLDVMIVKGSGVSTSTLLEAGAATIDLVIAITGSDEVNMLCCLTAKKLGAKRTIARIRDPKYAREISLIKEDLGLDMVINPEESAAEEIAGILTFPGAKRLERFANGRVRMVEITVTPTMKISGIKMKDLHKKINASILIGIIIRNNELIIPHGDLTLQPEDSIYVIGKTAEVYKFCVMVQEHSRKIKNVMIVGGGKISYYLAKILSNMFMQV
ncbi:MAG: NAD-binding protein, partial [Turicibacter sp.]